MACAQDSWEGLAFGQNQQFSLLPQPAQKLNIDKYQAEWPLFGSNHSFGESAASNMAVKLCSDTNIS